MDLNWNKLVPKLVCKIKAMKSRPGHWNHMGEMDEYVDQHVIITRANDTFVDCDPIFKTKERGWAWDADNFVKANTIQTIPDWVKT